MSLSHGLNFLSTEPPSRDEVIGDILRRLNCFVTRCVAVLAHDVLTDIPVTNITHNAIDSIFSRCVRKISSSRPYFVCVYIVVSLCTGWFGNCSSWSFAIFLGVSMELGWTIRYFVFHRSWLLAGFGYFDCPKWIKLRGHLFVADLSLQPPGRAAVSGSAPILSIVDVAALFNKRMRMYSLLP